MISAYLTSPVFTSKTKIFFRPAESLYQWMSAYKFKSFMYFCLLPMTNKELQFCSLYVFANGSLHM